MESLYVEALRRAENLPPTPANLDRVARETSPEASRWAFNQWVLRAQAAEKFELADRMLFDREGLEMATHEQLAAYHASLFPKDATVFDLTVGLGADAIALARRGPTVGFEIDPARCEYARHNLEVHGSEADIRNESWELASGVEYFYLDPARRREGRRTLDPGQFMPDPREVLGRFPDVRLGAVKLSPMIPDDYLNSLGARLEFVSFGRECREALVYVGSEVEPGRFAVMPEAGSTLPATQAHVPNVDTPDHFLLEADPAAIRANGLPELCRQFGLAMLGDSNGYLTGPERVESPWLRSFEVLSSDRFDMKSLRRQLVELGSGTPTLKQRGAGQDLEALRRKLVLDGTRDLSVAIYKVGASLRCVILDR